MSVKNITRTPLTILHDTLPKQHLGQWFTEKQELGLRIKPAFDNLDIMVAFSWTWLIADSATERECYRFQTEVTYTFDGAHSKAYLHELIYYLLGESNKESNTALGQTGSLLVLYKTFDLPGFEEIKPRIEEAFAVNHHTRTGVLPYWRKSPPTDLPDNDQLLNTLPEVPPYKFFKQPFSDENRALGAMIRGTASKEQQAIISQSLDFYHTCFEHLGKIDLLHLTSDQKEKLEMYCHFIFNPSPVIGTEMEVTNLFRVTPVSKSFLDNGKVRKANFLSYPPASLVKDRGVYNRANSPDRTVFYAAQLEQVALRETHPPVGQRIILSTWNNHSRQPLNTFSLCISAGIENTEMEKATAAFEKQQKHMNDLLGDWMQTRLHFMTNQFIQENPSIHPKRFDYFFSAYFADKVLQPLPIHPDVHNYECIIYPSVAWAHIPSNLAILPEVIDKKFRPILAREYEVLNTCYDRRLPLHEWHAQLKLIRTSIQITDGSISWDDD